MPIQNEQPIGTQQDNLTQGQPVRALVQFALVNGVLTPVAVQTIATAGPGGEIWDFSAPVPADPLVVKLLRDIRALLCIRTESNESTYAATDPVSST